MPQISVIVPVYKVEKYIYRCVDSILAQTYTDFELILVDDGSPDSCGAICDEYAKKDSRVVVIHQENGGLSAARNAGIDWAFANSDSEWLTFVDSDDWIVPDYLEMLYAGTDISDIVTCNAKYYHENEIVEVNSFSSERCVFSGRDACLHLYKMDGMISIEAWAKLYRKVLFRNVRFPNGKIHEDQAIVPILLYNATNVTALKATIYCYFVREESIMNQKFSGKRFDDLEALNTCISFFEKRGEADISKLAEHRRDFLWGLYTLYAHKAKVANQIPKEYRISISSAIRKMELRASFDKVTWYIAKVYPEWVRPYSYWCKIRKIMHIRIGN